MRKSDKKTDNAIRSVLTEVCDSALESYAGFMWLTHLVNYDKFPDSLKVVCIFDTNDNLQSFLQSKHKADIEQMILVGLAKAEVKVKNATKHISFDSEENCDASHNGNWAKRLSQSFS